MSIINDHNYVSQTTITSQVEKLQRSGVFIYPAVREAIGVFRQSWIIIIIMAAQHFNGIERFKGEALNNSGHPISNTMAL